jgi:hypothetical protein
VSLWQGASRVLLLFSDHFTLRLVVCFIQARRFLWAVCWLPLCTRGVTEVRLDSPREVWLCPGRAESRSTSFPSRASQGGPPVVDTHPASAGRRPAHRSSRAPSVASAAKRHVRAALRGLRGVTSVRLGHRPWVRSSQGPKNMRRRRRRRVGARGLQARAQRLRQSGGAPLRPRWQKFRGARRSAEGMRGKDVRRRCVTWPRPKTEREE